MRDSAVAGGVRVRAPRRDANPDGVAGPAGLHGVAKVERQAWASDPDKPRHGYTDAYGNGCQRLDPAAGSSTLRYDALVAVAGRDRGRRPRRRRGPAAELPDDVLHVHRAEPLLPARRARGRGLAAVRLHGKPGYRRVQAICDHVHEHLRFALRQHDRDVDAPPTYVRRASASAATSPTSAITFCRALNIPARYVFGYLPDMDVEPTPAPMDFAAWMEVFLDGRWWTFDPRNNKARKGRVVIGRGRDAVDVAMAHDVRRAVCWSG